MLKKNAKSGKINVCLKECIVLGVGTSYYQPQQFLPCAMTPVSFWCDGFLCQWRQQTGCRKLMFLSTFYQRTLYPMLSWSILVTDPQYFYVSILLITIFFPFVFSHFFLKIPPDSMGYDFQRYDLWPIQWLVAWQSVSHFMAFSWVAWSAVQIFRT